MLPCIPNIAQNTNEYFINSEAHIPIYKVPIFYDLL